MKSMTGYTFEDLIDVQQLQELMDLLFEISRIPSAILDVDGRIRVAAGWQDICTKFHRIHPIAAMRCRESDEYIKQHLHKKKYVAYKCKNGLWDVAVPIVIVEKHVATFFLGQFFFQDEETDEEFFRKQAEEFGFDVNEYLSALHRVPVFSRERMQHVIDYNLSFVKLLSTLGLRNLQLTSEVRERQHTEKALRTSSRELGDRVKELDCLYSISSLVNEKGSLIEETIQEIADLLPPAMQHPELTCARVLLREEAFETKNFRETESKIGHDILFHGKPIGRLEVCLLERTAEGDEDPFLDEERGLIEAVGERIGRILERNQAEEALKESQEQLYQAQKMETLGVLIAGVAHEINNPTNLIMLNVRLLQKIWQDVQPILKERAKREPERKYGGLKYDFLDENIGQLLSDMEMGGNRIARCVADLKDFARNSEVTEKQPISVNTAVENALRLAQTTIRKSKVDLKLALEHDLPLIDGNLQSIEQILLNILVNAVQAIDHDQGRIQVISGFEKETGRVFLSVSDNGHGIDPAISDRIYEPFVTNKQTEGGLGLGLSITKNLTEVHGGEISFNSQKGEGTTFSVFLPCLGE
jgi:C4-dicarboxylate-specific signal transduction histidine kinase